MERQYYGEEYGGEPIPFLQIIESEDQEAQFVLAPESEHYLKQMTSKKVAVLTIAGPQRSGKSFLANRFLKKMGGFAIGPTTNPCTKGIWLWGKPISLNDEMDLLIMDTEGLNSTQRDQTIDMKIFSISILLSSYFMYNSFGHIDENALENLSLVVHLSENISISSQQNNENDYSKYFPYFHWVLRDFSLDLKGRSSSQYLEYALQSIQGNEPDKQRKNNIRTKIKNYFKARDCTCLVRPLVDERLLAHIEQQSWDDLRADFREHVEFLTNNVMASIRPKIIQGKPLTGEMLLNLTKNYLQAINTGGVPQIVTSMERVISSEMKRIFDTLVKEYMSMLEEAFNERNLPMPEDELLRKHKDMTNYILKKLSANGEIIGHKEVAMITQKLQQGFEKNLKNKLDMNEEKITAISNKAISKFSAQLPIPHAADIQEGFAEVRLKVVNPFKESYAQFYEAFKSELKGSNRKFAIYSDTMPKLIFDYYDKIIEICEQLKEEEVDDVKKKLVQAREGEEALRKILEDNQSLLNQIKQEKSELRDNYDDMKRELDKAYDSSESEIDKLKHQIKQLNIQLDNEKKKSGSNFDTLGTTEEKLIYKLKEEILELKGEAEILRDKEKTLKREVDRNRETIRALEESLEEAVKSNGSTQRYTPTKARDEVEENEDDDELLEYKRNPQTEGLISEIVALKKKVKELEAGRRDDSNFHEETKDSHGGKGDTTDEDIELLDDSNIVQDQLLELCPNGELKEKVKIILTNYGRQKVLFQKKLGIIFRENNRLKAESIDLNEKMKEVKKKDEQIETLKQDIRNMNTAINQNSRGLIAEGSLEMQLAQANSERIRLNVEKENIVFFIKDLILKIKKKKNNHYDHAFSSLSAEDQQAILDLYAEIGFKF